MRERAILTFAGVLDTDTDHKFVKPEDHIAAKNLYSTVTEKGGTKFVMPGTVQVTSDLTEDFVITGVFEEKTTNKIYYLVYNPSGADRVYVYDPLDTSSPNGVTRELCRFEGLDLDPDFLAQGDIVDGKYLIWCESNQIKNTLEHNGIKKLNLERADVNKRFVYRLAVTQDSEPDEDHYYRFYDVNGVAQGAAVKFYDPVTGESSVQARLEAIATALNAVSGIGAVAYPNYVEITMDTAWQRLYVYSDAATDQDGLTDWPDAKYNGQSLLFWAYNHYPLAATRDMFDLCKRPMPCAPFHEFQENPDALAPFTDVHNGAWQFITRIHYIDNEVSAWSEPSIIATDKAIETQEIDINAPDLYATWPAPVVNTLQKQVVCRYYADILSDETFLSLVSYIEVAVRKGYESPYYQFEKIKIEDAISDIFSTTFRNDRIGTIIASDDAFTDITTQVLKKFDWVPRGSGSIGLVSEESGNSRVLIGSPLEGYDNVPKADCTIEFELSTDFDTDRKLLHRLKELGVYKFGIEYLDNFGRTSDVIPIGTYQVPEHVQYSANPFDFKVIRPKISIAHRPPSWASRYRIVRTRNLKHRNFFQWVTFRGAGIDDWKSARVADPDMTQFDLVTFEESTHTLITLPVDIGGANSDQFFLFDEKNSIGGFIPQKGDILKLIRAKYVDTDTSKYYSLGKTEYEILGIYIDVDSGRRSIIVDKILAGTVNGTTPIDGIVIVEVFRPNEVEDVVYLETGNCFDVELSGGIYIHKGNDQDQTSTDPAIIDFVGGDISWVSKSANPYDYYYDEILTGNAIASAMIYNLYPLESQYFSIDENNACDSVGRANLEDSIKESYVYNRIRYSGISVPNSLTNNLNAFRGADVISLNEAYGAISGLVLSGNTLLAICFNKCQPIYLNRQDILNIDNAGLLGTSNKLFALASELRGNFGCQNKESIHEENGNVYGWDKRTGTIWRYDANGINDIRQKTVTLFGEIGDERKTTLVSDDRVFTGYDRRRDLFFIYFAPIDGSGRCFIYDEKINGWIGEIDMAPQMFSMVNDKLISFNENQLYVHDGEGAIYANIYGNQVVPEITKVFNTEPTVDKIPWTAAIRAGKRWDFSNIEAPVSQHFKEGQQSRIIGDRWKNLSGTWTAAFLRDMRDTKASFLAIPNMTTRERTALLSGRHLKGSHFVITLRLPDPEDDALFSTEIEYSKPE